MKIVPALDLGLELLRRFAYLNGSVLVGHIAYRSFMWFVPLVLVAIGLLGYGAAEGIDIVRFGREAGLDGSLLDTTSEEASGAALQVMLVGLIALVMATRSIVRAVFFVFAQAWEIEPRTPRRTVRAVGITLASALVFVAVTAAISALAGRGPVFFVGAGLAGTAATMAVLLAVSWLLPHRAPSILHLLPGTVMAVTGGVLIDLLGGLYFPRRLTGASQTYGSIGFVLVILLFLWLWAFLIVGSAFVNAVWCDRKAVLDGRPYVAAPELLPPWLRRLLPHPEPPDNEHAADHEIGEPPERPVPR